MGRTGKIYYFNYYTAYKADKAIKEKVNLALETLKKWIGYNVPKDGKKRYFTYGMVNVKPKSMDWKLALGGHNFIIQLSVIYSNKKKNFTMQYCIIGFDRYNFNKGESFLGIIPNSYNGRFVTLGWAKNFTSVGYMYGKKTWRV